MQFRTAYGKRNRVGKEFLMEDSDGKMVQAIGRTEQHHKDGCDINSILRRLIVTGKLQTNLQI